MTDLIVYPSRLVGEVEIPSSKSHSIRAIIFASLASGKSHISKRLDSADIHHTIRACRQIGAKIEEVGDDLFITGTAGKFNSPNNEIDAGNSGQVLRFIGALAALSDKPTRITGDHSIQTNRPVLPLLNGLNQLGAKAISVKKNDFAPIEVKGFAKPSVIKVEGKDSQPISALLMLSAFLEGETEIEVLNPGEKPWIDLTLSWLKKFQIPFKNENYNRYKVSGKKKIPAFNYTVPSDFSSAAFPAVAALIANSQITLKNMDMEDVQGDKKIFEMLKEMGAHITYDRDLKTLRVQREKGTLIGRRLDINDYIDAIAILSVLGCFAKSETHIENAGIARAKECDRIACITIELRKMGAKITENKEGLSVYLSQLKGADLKTHQDHRIAMSLIIAALNAKGKSIIRNIDCISKSYPSFIEDMKKLGASLEVV